MVRAPRGRRSRVRLSTGKRTKCWPVSHQERRSGFDHFAGYEEIMVRNVIAIGEDVGNLLNVF
jgi:ribosomal protein L32E